MAREQNSTIAELFDLQDRVALVTGGAGHLGSAISEALAEAGATVVIASRRLDNCRKRARQIESWGGSAVALKLDVTRDASAQQCLAQVRKRCGRLDVLVNNAYAGSFKSMAKTEPRDFTATLEGCHLGRTENMFDLALRLPFLSMPTTQYCLLSHPGTTKLVPSTSGASRSHRRLPFLTSTSYFFATGVQVSL